MKDSRIGLGIIGTGAVFRLMHLPVLARLKNWFRIEAIHDTDSRAISTSLDIAKKLNLPPISVVSKPSAIFHDKNIDAVAILTPISSHVKYTLSALANDKHVFLEKPAALRSIDIAKMIEMKAKMKKYVQVGMVLRYAGFYKELESLINSGRYGKVLWMNWIETRPFDPMQWRYETSAGNGDAIIHDKAVHQINLYNAFAGSKPRKVFASAGQYFLHPRRKRKLRAFNREVKLWGDSSDHLMTIIEYDNRVKAALTISYVSPHARESRWHIQLEKAKLLVHPETFVQNSLSPRESAKANDIASNRLGRFTGSPVHRFTGSSNPSCIYLFKDNANLRVPWKIPMSYPPSEENLFFYDDYKNDPLHPGSVAQWNSFYESVFNKKVRSKTGLEIALEDIKVTEAICKSIKLQRIIAL